jgi:uncharacterized protein YbaP (TraB family)
MPNRGALFKVQQGGRTLYLFGTIHVGARNFYPLEPRLSGLLEEGAGAGAGDRSARRSAKLARAVQRYGLRARASRCRRLAPAAGPSAAAVPHRTESVATMKPWLLASLLTVSEFAAQGYARSLAVDAHLSKQAHAGQKVVELESAESQMALFDTMTAASSAVPAGGHCGHRIARAGQPGARDRRCMASCR